MTKIVCSHYVLGSKKESLEEICKENPGWDQNKLLQKTGVKLRHILSETESPETLSIRAGKECLNKLGNKDVDGIIYVTQSPSNPLPTRACMLQNELGVSSNCLAFDINQGCAGFVYALSLANSLINSNLANRVLIICADYYSKYISKHDRTCRPIFSDAAAAVIIEKSKKFLIGPFIFKTDGSGGESLIVKEKNGIQSLYMDGPEVLKFSLKLVPQATYELLRKAKMDFEDIDLFIFHQASAVVLNKLQKKLNIDSSKWIKTIEYFGNTVSATIPIVLNDLQKSNSLHKYKNILLMGFGVGLSVAGCIISSKD